jgi:porphobilinogen synthase
MTLLHGGFHHPVLREWQTSQHLSRSSLIYPVFVSDQCDVQEEISSMPGQYRYGINRLEAALRPLVEHGLSTILLFGVVSGGKVS